MSYWTPDTIAMERYLKPIHDNVFGWNIVDRLYAMMAANEGGRRCVEQILEKHRAVLIDWKHPPGCEGIAREDYLIECVWPDIDSAERAIAQWRALVWTIDKRL